MTASIILIIAIPLYLAILRYEYRAEYARDESRRFARAIRRVNRLDS